MKSDSIDTSSDENDHHEDDRLNITTLNREESSKLLRRYSENNLVEITMIPRRGSNGEFDPVNTSFATINARRSGSATVLVPNERGEVTVERKGTDITIALRKRLSASSIPSIIPVAAPETTMPFQNANEALEKIGGKGAYAEHMYSLEILGEKFSTNIDCDNPSKSLGLSTQEAEELLAKHGPNVLTPPPKLPLWLLFLLQFTSALMVILEITATLCIILYIVNPSEPQNLYLGVLLFIVIIITCYETYSQEAKSDSLMEQFRAMVPSVIRDGSLKPVNTSDLVIGDIIRVKSGDKVPADCRVILAESMKVTSHF
jgi:magnesium-transporting ATPase (P-type)